MTIDPEEPLARAMVETIHRGDTEGLRRLLDTNPGLATDRIGHDRPGGETRSLLHVANDWPGHFPGGPDTDDSTAAVRCRYVLTWRRRLIGGVPEALVASS